MIPSVMSVEEAAGQLAGAIKETASWKSFQEATAEFEQDRVVSALFQEYRQLLAELQQAHGQGSPPSPDETQRLEQLQTRIQSSPVYQKREEAANGMIADLVTANLLLSEQLGFDFATNAMPPKSGGCCGGGENGGNGSCGCG